jgi:ABC-type lipoprotein release transport system permease subunit
VTGSWLYIKLAWRNLLRNKRRTFIAGTAIGMGLASLVFTDALMIGMTDHLVHSGTASFMGEGQVHREGFRKSLEVELTINDLDGVVSKLEASEIVERFTPRVMSFAMIGSPANNEGVTFFGVQPETERHLSQIDDVIVEGEYFAGGDRDIVLGSRLAELLEVELGDRVVITAAQAHSGDLSQELFRVSGIYHFNIKEMDRAMAFVPLSKAQQVLGLDGEVHEIALKFTDSQLATDQDLALWGQLSRDGNEAIGWPVLLPQLSAAMDLTDFSLLIVGLILFAVVSLGIINTLFMSLYERMFEFGVLRAVGTRPWAIFRLVLGEAGALSLVSIVLGIIISALILAWVANSGIDYTGIDYAGVTFREKIYPVVRGIQFVKYPLWVFLITTVVGLYPAAYAARLTPARAMRKSF